MGRQIERKTTTLFTDGILIYVDNSRKSTKKLLELIGKFSKFSVLKIDIQKQLHLYIQQQTIKNKIKNN